MKRTAAIALTAFVLLVGYGTLRAAEIHEAVKAGDLAKVKSLLERDPQSKDSRDEMEMSPLHYAAVGRRIDIIQLLVEHKADLENPGPQGRTPLVQAVIQRTIPLLQTQCANLLDRCPHHRRPWCERRHPGE